MSDHAIDPWALLERLSNDAQVDLGPELRQAVDAAVTEHRIELRLAPAPGQACVVLE